MPLRSIHPGDGREIAVYSEHSEADVEHCLTAADAAARDWRRTAFAERAERMRRAAALLRERRDQYARLMTDEMGKPIAQSRAEVDKCAWVCDYYAEHAERFLADEVVQTDARDSRIVYRPLGVILAIMPWNFPFWQVFRFAAPNVMAGNGGLLKHASNVTGCALAIEALFRDAGFPEDLFRVLRIGSARVSAVIGDARVRGVTLTGSTPAGRSVAAAAGAAIKKTVLELGGSDPYLILEDADLDAAAETCVTSRLINSGQSCIAAKRFIVVDAVRDAFEQAVVERMRAIVPSDPCEENCRLGPLAREDLRDELHDQVERSVASGARLLLGGAIPNRPGAWYPATVLTDVGPGMAAYQEELFGPVASIIPVPDEAEAIRVANDSPFGLGAAIFSRDVERARRIAADSIEAGNVFINDFVRSDPRLPFGGIKESGYGRELALIGIREFVNVKTVVVG